MDLNELFYHHQLALMRADTATPASDADCCVANRLGQRIAEALAHNTASIRAPSTSETCCA